MGEANYGPHFHLYPLFPVPRFLVVHLGSQLLFRAQLIFK